jgi:hypothetical protein
MLTYSDRSLFFLVVWILWDLVRMGTLAYAQGHPEVAVQTVADETLKTE